MNLSELKNNQSAKIKDLNWEIIPNKLLEMGFLPDAIVTKITNVPFNGPILVHLNHKHNTIALRKTEADLFELTSLSE